VSRGAVAALFLSQMLAGGAFAQSVVPPAAASDASLAAPYEFGRVSSGEIDLITKHSQRLSGSLGMTMSRSQLPLATGRNGTTNGYDATLGGTILEDRLWFFASALQSDALLTSRFATALPPTGRSDRVVSRGIDSKFSAQIGDRQSLAASFAAGRELGVTTALNVAAPNPASFLSLRYTGVVSNNMFFNANFSRRSAVQPELPFAAVVQPR
jgi:hypothetical protein